MRLLMRLASGLLGLSMVLTMPALADDIVNWSSVDGSNNRAAPNGWQSGVMLPSQVEPSARAIMGAVRRFWDLSAPHAHTNTALQGLLTATYPNGVWRDDYSTGLGAPPLWFKPETGTCASNSRVNDGGSCVNTTSGDGNSFFSVPPTAGWDPREFGADPTGAAASGAAIQNAINAAGATAVPVLFPCGTFSTDTTALTISGNNVGFGGPRGGCAFLRTTSATVNVLTVSGTYNRVHDLQFNATVPRTAGSYIVLNGLGNRVFNYVLNAPFTGITMNGTDLYIDKGWILNTVATTGVSIYVTGGNTAQHIGYVFAQAAGGSQPKAGVLVDNTGDLTFDPGSQFLDQGTGILATPGNSQAVDSLTTTGTIYLDHDGTNGMNLCPTGTGVIQRARFVGLWLSSSSGNGLVTCAGVNGADFIDAHVFLNTSEGVSITGGTDINFVGGQFAQNGDQAFIVAASVVGWSVTGAAIGAVSGLTANTNGGIFINSGGDYFVITGNSFISQTSSISDGSGGTHKTVMNNPGDPNDFNAYRENSSGLLVIRGQQASFSGFKFITPAGTVLSLSNSGAPTLPGLPTSAGAGGLNVCVDTSGAFYKKSSCP